MFLFSQVNRFTLMMMRKACGPAGGGYARNILHSQSPLHKIHDDKAQV